MLNRILIQLFLFSFLLISNGYSQVIENLDFVQEGKNIRITYDLVGTEIGQQFNAGVYFSTDGGRTWQGPLQEVTGNVGQNQVAGRNLSITWDVLAEKKSLVGEVRFKIEATIQEGYDGDSAKIYDKTRRKGYIGISGGLAIPSANDHGYLEENGYDILDHKIFKTGYRLNFVEFGYLFTKNLGIAAQVSIGNNNSIIVNGNDPWTFSSITAGLLVTYPSRNIDYDLRIMIGYLTAGTTLELPSGGNGNGFTGKLGIGMRIHVAKKISLLLSADIMRSNPDFGEWRLTIFTYNLSGGIAFRLK